MDLIKNEFCTLLSQVQRFSCFRGSRSFKEKQDREENEKIEERLEICVAEWWENVYLKKAKAFQEK